MNTEEKVRETLESGLEPIELTYRTVYNCSMQDPIAYRTKLVINSVTLGTLGPESYSITAEQSGRAARIAAKAFDLILRKINEFTAKGTTFEWISYECPVTLLMNGDLAESINTAYGGDKKKLSKLCVEFPSSILYSDPADIKNKLLDLQALGINTLINGFGSEFCPVLRLGLFPVNFVALDPVQCSYMQQKELAQSVESVCNYITGLHAAVIAEDLSQDSEAAPWYRCDAFGFTRANDTRTMTFDEDGDL